MKKHMFAAFAVGLFTLAALAAPASAAVASTVYDATPSTLPPNVPSLGFQATSTSELGDEVHLAGTDRRLSSVTATMSTWATYSEYANNVAYSANTTSWSHPLTVNVYSTHLDGDGKPDQLLASKTKLATIPWRPAADATCPDTGYGAGVAWRASDGQCYNGYAFNVDFDMSSPDVTLPNDVIVTVAYNTQSYGHSPLGVAGPYNSLNVGIPTNQTVSVGSDANTDQLFIDTTYPPYTAGLRLDSGWTPNGTAALKVTALPAAHEPANKDACKNNGWSSLTTADGTSFKNQGACVSYVASKGNGASVH